MRSLRWLLAGVLALTGVLTLSGQRHAVAATTSTSQFRGINGADQRDNFVNGVLYPSGLGSSDTYASASTVANQVFGQLYSITGANTSACRSTSRPSPATGAPTPGRSTPRCPRAASSWRTGR